MTVKFVELPSLLFQLVFGFALCRRWDEDGSGELEFEEHQLGRDETWMWGNGGMNQLHVIFIDHLMTTHFYRCMHAHHPSRTLFIRTSNIVLTCLDQEVVRAFAKSFHVDVEGIAGLRENLRAVWCIFDRDNSGAIDRQEFMLPNDGLADMVLATMHFLRKG